MRLFFYRYSIQNRLGSSNDDVPSVVVIVDQKEASARQRLLLMHPSALVLKVEQTPFDADRRPSCQSKNANF